MNTLGARLKKLRNDKGVTQEDMGKDLNIAKSTISQYENNVNTPDAEMLKKLAAYFNTSVDYMLGIKYSSETIYLPILGTIRAGLPLLAEDNWQNTIEISNEIKADFALRVVGDSMSWVGIHDGDLALLRQSNVAQNGQIVAAGVEGPTWEATLKFYMSTNSHYVLRAANPAYPDMLFTEKHRIIGTVVNIIKDAPSIFTYRDFLTLKEIHDDDWAEAIEKAAQYGLGAKDVAQYIEMLSKMITKIEK